MARDDEEKEKEEEERSLKAAVGIQLEIYKC